MEWMNKGECAVGFSSCRRSCCNNGEWGPLNTRYLSLIGISTLALIREKIGATVGLTVATVCHRH